MGSWQIAMSEMFFSLSSGSRSIRLLHFGGLELFEVVVPELRSHNSRELIFGCFFFLLSSCWIQLDPELVSFSRF